MIKWVGCNSSNYKVGRSGKKVDLIILHHAVSTLAGVDATFQDPNRQASAHYCVGRGGEIHQYVGEGDTSYNSGVFDINLRSVSIEHEDLAADNYTDLQYETSAELVAGICRRFNLDETNIHAHREYKATQCPGALNIERIRNRVRQMLKGEQMIHIDNGVTIEIVSKTNLRSVPTDNQGQYSETGVLDVGNQAEVIGQTSDNNWLNVNAAGIKQGWLKTPVVKVIYRAPATDDTYKKKVDSIRQIVNT